MMMLKAEYRIEQDLAETNCDRALLARVANAVVTAEDTRLRVSAV